jgi:hypothetical protein
MELEGRTLSRWLKCVHDVTSERHLTRPGNNSCPIQFDKLSKTFTYLYFNTK